MLQKRKPPLQARAKNRNPRSSKRGFTLIELMTVVVIVGVLAMLGLVAYRRFITSSKTSEAIYMVGAIRSAEESFRAETLSYLDVGFSTYFPSDSPGKFKTAWSPDTSTPLGRNWAQLGARPDGPVYYGYRVGAGGAGATPPTLTGLINGPTWPTTTGPWYVIQAKGDVDGNGVYSYVAGSSFTSEIYVENEGE
jgi:prepilin-type N-terminal cleavage/methylation domain-containing protein